MGMFKNKRSVSKSSRAQQSSQKTAADASADADEVMQPAVEEIGDEGVMLPAVEQRGDEGTRRLDDILTTAGKFSIPASRPIATQSLGRS